MKSVLFYDDGCSFGGHSVTTVDAVRYLLENTNLNISFMFYEENIRLCERLSLIQNEKPKLKLYPIKYKQGKLKNIGAFLSFLKINKIKSLIDDINPDLVIIAQGFIEQCSLGLLAAKRGGYKTVSFIALTQDLSLMGANLAELRDKLNLYFYRLPDKFITISQSAKLRLIEYGVKSEISLVYCGLDLRIWKSRERDKSRQLLGVEEKDYLIGLIGRVQFSHKGHDFLIDSISQHLDKLENIKLIIVGDGPDLPLLQSLINIKGLTNYVKLVPWSNDSSHIYSAIDMLVIPSRFEGLPLVMLEAMYYELPIIASNVDGMAEVLPKEWLFQFGDNYSLIETLLRVKSSDNNKILSKNKSLIISNFNAEKFGQSFYESIRD